MQNDLISRQAVIDIIHKEIEKTTSFAEHETQINIEMAVEELPTAYSVEKVVADAEERTKCMDCSKCRHWNGIQAEECNEDCCDAIIDDVLDIVRNGGKE